MRVMVIGASTNPEKFGHRAVLAYRRQGHTVLPVNPAADAVADVPAYADVAAVPGPIDRATMYLPPQAGIETLDALAARGDVAELWLNPGSASPELVDKARRLGLDPIQACSIIDIGERP